MHKFLAACGVGSRRRCEALIAAGAVAVDGRAVMRQGETIVPGLNRVTVRGREVRFEPVCYWLLHKPVGCVSTCHDPQGRRTVLDLLPRAPARLYPVGRLDYDSEGLLILTNDGELAHRLAHPRHEIEKRYRATLDGELDAAAMRRLTRGLSIDGALMRMAGIRRLRRSPQGPVYEVRLREGRNRQIRRMMAAAGRTVRRLARVQFGPLALGDLPPGAARPLTSAEVQALRRVTALEQRKPRGGDSG